MRYIFYPPYKLSLNSYLLYNNNSFIADFNNLNDHFERYDFPNMYLNLKENIKIFNLMIF